MIKIRELREAKGIQQKSLAIDLGVSQPTVSDWESGRKTPSARSTQKLADYFGVTIDYLLGREDTKKDPTADSSDGAFKMPIHNISDDEYSIILAYRQASPADRQIIDNIISRYSPTSASTDKAV